MFKKWSALRIGPRTLKTALAVTLSIIMVSFYGSSTSNLIFATIGALSAMGATFKESLLSCYSQIAGVLFGVFAGVLLLSLHMPPLLASGIGIIIVITFYNLLRLRFSPTLACIIVVTICHLTYTTPFVYAKERIWDTAIGLIVGMLVNLLIYPYDNSKQIRKTIERLDKELIHYLEDMFNGDETVPKANKMLTSLDEINHGLKIFSDQKLLFHLKKQQKDLSSLLNCEKKARQLVVHLEILSDMPFPGILTVSNKERLERNGAKIKDQRVITTELKEIDVVTNYHVNQVLDLRRELLDILREN